MSYELKKFNMTVINGHVEKVQFTWVHVCYPSKQVTVELIAKKQSVQQTIDPLIISGSIEYEPVIKYHLTGHSLLNGIYEDITMLLSQHGCDFVYHDIDYYDVII